jgi:hypothetical protein
VGLTSSLIARGQAAGHICPGTPEVLSRILSGIVTSYQTFAVGEADASALDRFGTHDLAALVRRTFAAPTP